MKVGHYLRKHNLNSEQGKKEIRVIIMIEWGNSKDLQTHLEKELFEDIGKQSSLEIHNKDLFVKPLKEILDVSKKSAKFKQTIILLDECKGSRMDYYRVNDFEEKHSVDYIHCMNHGDLKIRSRILEEKVQINTDSVFVTLLQRQRSSQPILDISHFLDGHSGQSAPIAPVPDIPNPQDSFGGPKTQWMEIKDAKAFVRYAEEKLSEFKGEAMVIRKWNSNELPEISALCSKLEWKFCKNTEVRGSESSLVIIYGFENFTFESFTRAKHNLLIVTLSGQM